MQMPAPEAFDAEAARRSLLVRSLAGAVIALLISMVIGVLWRARGWPHRLDASLAGFFITMAIAWGVFLPTHRPRSQTLLFAFTTAAAAWVLVHYLGVALLGAR